MVHPDPSFEEMENLVCKMNGRPIIQESLYKDETISEMLKMIKESWSSKPASRLTIFKMKRKMESIKF